ncbi:hypothetical protein [Granulicella sp. L46]|jgi:hypothetical protein|uniref:hypothetical protein n=1 Tax=Granulicella sp. L46 TaxID=1641865 RepID=UPI00131D8FCA|nr:hypothetical protein [Granulicella sp. L46]
MNQSINMTEMTLAPVLKASLCNRVSRAALAFLGLFILLFTATGSAKAATGCYTFGGGNNGVKFPMPDNNGVRGPDSIVGLWHVVYTTTSGAPFGVSLKEWHSDGTEFENIDHPAVVGNICFGVWKQVELRTVRLHHTGWTFDDNGNPTGSFTIDETDTLAPNGMSYTGNFTFKVFDTNGDFISGSETTGTIAASRITVN